MSAVHQKTRWLPCSEGRVCQGWWPLVSPESKIVSAHHWYPRRWATSDSSDSSAGSSKAYEWLAQWIFQNCGCSAFVNDVFTNLLNWYMWYFLWKSLIIVLSLFFYQISPKPSQKNEFLIYHYYIVIKEDYTIACIKISNLKGLYKKKENPVIKKKKLYLFIKPSLKECP